MGTLIGQFECTVVQVYIYLPHLLHKVGGASMYEWHISSSCDHSVGADIDLLLLGEPRESLIDDSTSFQV